MPQQVLYQTLQNIMIVRHVITIIRSCCHLLFLRFILNYIWHQYAFFATSFCIFLFVQNVAPERPKPPARPSRPPRKTDPTPAVPQQPQVPQQPFVPQQAANLPAAQGYAQSPGGHPPPSAPYSSPPGGYQPMPTGYQPYPNYAPPGGIASIAPGYPGYPVAGTLPPTWHYQGQGFPQQQYQYPAGYPYQGPPGGYPRQ